MHLFATTSSQQMLELGKAAAVTEIEQPLAAGDAGASVKV
jgi:hypothetical protein